jgi:hypothetical protein
VRASDLVRLLETAAPPRQASVLPRGVERVIPDDRAMTLTVRGTAKAVAEVKQMIGLLDVTPRETLVKLRVVRVRFAPGGGREEETLGTPVVSTLNNKTARVAVSGGLQDWSVEVTPHINGDGSISLLAKLNLSRIASSPREALTTGEQYRRVPAGKTARLAPITDSADPRVQEFTRKNLVLDDLDRFKPPSALTLYYLEATPAEVTRKTASSATP